VQDVLKVAARARQSVQFGDDKHITMPGLCQTINVTVAQ